MAFSVLKANLAINGVLEEHVKTLDVACSDIEEEIEVRTCVPPYRTMKAIAKPLDRILEELGVELSRRSVIIMDVEGAGIKVLKGSIDTLSKSRPRIIMELHKGEEKAQELLESLGYVITKPSDHFIVAK